MFSPVQDCRSGPNKVRWESVPYILTERREVLTARLNVEIIWNCFAKTSKVGVVYLSDCETADCADESDQAATNIHLVTKIVRNGATPWVLYHCVTTAAVCG